MRILRVLLVSAAVLGFAWGSGGDSTSTSTAHASALTILAPKSSAPVPAGIDTSIAPAVVSNACVPQSTAAVTLTVITPRTDGIFVGNADDGAVGIRFLPDGTLLYAIDVQGTSVQQLKTELTLQNVTTARGDWEHVQYDSVGDFELNMFGGEDDLMVRSYTDNGFVLHSQNNFGCPGGQVNLSNTTMRFYK